MSREKVEEMMKELECTGDRVFPEDIKNRIEEVEYTTIELCGNKFMYCGIKMKGGFVVVGKPAACIDPSNWRDAIGQTISFENSFDEIWRLEAYRKMST